MKSILTSFVLIFCAGVFAASAQTPRLTGTEPYRLVVEPEARGTATIRLKGSDLVRKDTTGYTINNDVEVFVRGTAGSGAFQKLEFTGWAGGQLTVLLDEKTYMSRPDRLEFKVTVRGVGDSNVQALEVLPYPTVPPQIQANEAVRAVPRMPLAVDKNSNDRTVSLDVKNLTGDTKVFIRGKEASLGRLVPGEGWLLFWIPQEFQRLGDYYTVHLKNRNGESNTTRILVVTSPTILSVNPSTIEYADGDGNQQVKIDFVSSQKPEAFIRGEGNASDWQRAALSDAKELVIPKTLLAQSERIEIKLKNIGGEAVANVRVQGIARGQRLPKIILPIDRKPVDPKPTPPVVRPKVIKPPR